MKRIISNCRYIERDVMYQKMLKENKNMTIKQIESILCGIDNWEDVTFKFYSDGSCSIYCNNSERELKPSDLSAAAYDFYVRKRIETIRTKIINKPFEYTKTAITAG